MPDPSCYPGSAFSLLSLWKKPGTLEKTEGKKRQCFQVFLFYGTLSGMGLCIFFLSFSFFCCHEKESKIEMKRRRSMYSGFLILIADLFRI